LSAQRGERPFGLIAFYVLYFMTVGVSLPFLPGYFQALGFTGAQAGTLLSVAPTFALFMPPVWGQLADRLGRPGLVLLVVSVGTAAGYGLLAGATRFEAALLALAVTATFSTGIVPLIDAQALAWVQANGGDYARIRIFGSFGFVLAALPFGFLVTTIDRVTVLLPLGLTSLAALLCGLTLARAPRVQHQGPRPTLGNVLELLRRREVLLFLAATTTHWMASTPYHGSMAPFVKALGLPPSVVSLSFTVGVVAEVVVMLAWPRWSSRWGARTLLVGSFLVGVVRWGVMAVSSSAPVLVAVAALHGFTFGAFYVGAVGWMTQATPPSLRATGQALFAAVTFGVGGVVGFRVSGLLFDALGGPGLFGVAAGLELLPAALVALALAPREERPPEATAPGR
jgi:PPP family 3-phenylpropionic acid transporter